jgi:outer membrane protein OmpA-like peptidoglycan-associated protein
VQYNYGPTSSNDYTYGLSPVQIKQLPPLQAAYPQQSAYQQQAKAVMAKNNNISIDFSALNDGSTTTGTTVSTFGLASGEPLVYFNHGSARLGTLDKKRIREFAQHLKSQGTSVVLIGHASKRTGIHDPVASEDANLTISAKRAAVVLKELAKNGVKGQQVKITASGDAVANPNPADKGQEAADRRVEILFDQ